MNWMFRSLALITFFVACTATAAPLGSEFTFQGELQDAGMNAVGSYEFEFEPFDAVSGGTSLAAPLTRTINLVDGVFTTQLDFGDAPFMGDAVWLEVRARSVGAGNFTTLSPRQPVTAAPYALHTQFVADNAVASAEIADGSVASIDIANEAVGSSQIDSSQVQRRVAGTCPAGQSIRAIDVVGGVLCEPDDLGDDDWLPLGDGRLQNITGVRIQPDPVAMFPFTIRHQSNINSPTAALVESEVDFARLSFYTDPNESFWTIAGLSAANSDDDLLNFYNSAAGDVLTIRGNSRVGINNTTPGAALHVAGGDVRVTNMGHPGPDPRPVLVEADGDLVTGPAPGGVDKYLTLGPEAFRPQSSDQGHMIFAALAFLTTTSGNMVATVQLPDGSDMKEIITHFRDDSTTNNLVITLLSGGLGGNSVAVLASVTTSGDVAGYRVDSDTITSSGIVNNLNSYYFVEVTGTPNWTGNTGTGIQAVVIRYR